ncbi:MAG: RNA polymerase sigma factor SigZ [Proteobacteria bacterium]|nr:RNA polymerase sigma factor SigZ [Pseudomonadota bacterium]MBU1582950.1 RNA polymerase sigma factor SigZ [Pseudomonadota bacterium]MBU2455080.1 RNA polymerase sigma factor SigZ [Pseudomonadota bacterium]MBU2630128.1 RNA polymerase sigma factor SigZ [Pseudomonadota bacterium]
MKTICNCNESDWKKFGRQLKIFIKKKIKPEDNADDILMEVFMKIEKNIDQLKDTEKLVPWVYRITRNTITDHYRKKTIATIDIDTLPEIPDKNNDVDRSEEIKNALKPFIDALPKEYKNALVSIDIEGMTQKDFAVKHAISLSGAKSRIQRARTLLKKELCKCCEFHSDVYGNIYHYQRKINDTQKGIE